jgi:hypothetical protein
MKSQAFLYYTHYISDAVRREISRLNEEIPRDYDLWVVGCTESCDAFETLMVPRAATRAYSRVDFQALPYPGKMADLRPNTMRGSNDLAIMMFFREHQEYSHYWIAENDVRYTGSWTALLDELGSGDADLMCTHVTAHAQDPDWEHWGTLKQPDGDHPKDGILRGFMPFCSITKRLFGKIDEYCSLGWRGHYEVLWPTIASLEGFDIEEIGGDSPFTPRSRSNRFYHSRYINKDLFLSTFGAWPNYSDTSDFNAHLKDTLWHPVKDLSPPSVSSGPKLTEASVKRDMNEKSDAITNRPRSIWLWPTLRSSTSTLEGNRP